MHHKVFMPWWRLTRVSGAGVSRSELGAHSKGRVDADESQVLHLCVWTLPAGGNLVTATEQHKVWFEDLLRFNLHWWFNSIWAPQRLITIGRLLPCLRILSGWSAIAPDTKRLLGRTGTDLHTVYAAPRTQSRTHSSNTSHSFWIRSNWLGLVLQF